MLFILNVASVRAHHHHQKSSKRFSIIILMLMISKDFSVGDKVFAIVLPRPKSDSARKYVK